jgi:two-component system KDP operon response regulator KdpE
MEATILVVEDDKSSAWLLQDILEPEGFRVLRAADGVEGLRIVQERQPDLVLLDIMMPRMDGWETCRQIREFSDVPIIILTCKVDELDKVRGLELGADDYVTKPHSKLELLARVRAALRRTHYPLDASQLVHVDDRLVIDRGRREVLVDGEAVDLSVTEFRLLLCLLDNAGCISTHSSLLTQVWGWEYADEKDYLKTYIYHLRQKIEPDPHRPTYILTEHRQGYRFQPPPSI